MQDELPKNERTRYLGVYVPAHLFAEIEAYAGQLSERTPGGIGTRRSQAIRALLAIGLKEASRKR